MLPETMTKESTTKKVNHHNKTYQIITQKNTRLLPQSHRKKLSTTTKSYGFK